MKQFDIDEFVVLAVMAIWLVAMGFDAHGGQVNAAPQIYYHAVKGGENHRPSERWKSASEHYGSDVITGAAHPIPRGIDRIASFQSRTSTATVSISRAKCPNYPDRPIATMSKSEWNKRGWPLWRITCAYERR